MSFISALADDLVKRRDVYDLSRISELYFFGLKETATTIDFVGLVSADGLDELEIVEIRNRFLEAVQQAVYDFGTRTYGRNPNGLLIFVFEQESPGRTPEFIRKQTRATIFQRPAVIFSWTVDTKEKRIHTHDPWVNAIPPIYILESTVFPGKNYIAQFLDSYVPVAIVERQERGNPKSQAKESQRQGLTTEDLEQIQSIFEEQIKKMPKYNLPNVTKLQVFKNVNQYIENQTVSDPEVKTALDDLSEIIQTLQTQHPQANEQQAAEVLEVEFEAIKRREPNRWKQLLNLKRWWNGAKKGALKAGEHYTDSTPFGKAAVGFLEGFSDNVG